MIIDDYSTFKHQYPDTVLFFRRGDFYEAYLEDATLVSKTAIAGLTITSRGDTPVAVFPFHSLENCLALLIGEGHRVAIYESGMGRTPIRQLIHVAGKLPEDMPICIHPDDAKQQGFTVDSHCYPWYAYKGERFQPTEAKQCYTELESQLIRERNPD